MTVATGLDRWLNGSVDLPGHRAAVLCHAASVDRRLRHIVNLIGEDSRLEIVRILGPEHGFLGAAQDMEPVEGGFVWRGIPVTSLYGFTEKELKPTPEDFDGADFLLVDLQDVGSRYYTYAATMAFCMETAADIGLPVVVLDRPNPIGGRIEGFSLEEAFRSFVGILPVPTRHGLTIGELAKVVHGEMRPDVQLQVVDMEGWQRSMYFEQTGLPWVMPSPNMPTVDTAVVYPGGCLLEGTNLSEGRGTTRPFELFGAPWLDVDRILAKLSDEDLRGCALRTVEFLPTFQKWAGKSCRGFQLHVTDRERFDSIRTYLALLVAIFQVHSSSFAWRNDEYEFVGDRLAFDLLIGHDRVRSRLEAGEGIEALLELSKATVEAFAESRNRYLIYPES